MDIEPRSFFWWLENITFICKDQSTQEKQVIAASSTVEGKSVLE
jgi:hypothetical protein